MCIKTLSGTHGVYEMRIDYGPGFRVYFARSSTKIILLLGGGDKASQEKDIGRCAVFWKMYKENSIYETQS